MGGNAFSNVQPITLSQLQVLWPKLLKTLKQLNCQEVIPIGTTFQKETMGDIDIAVRHSSKDILHQSLLKHFGEKNVCLIGGSTVSIAYASHQVDITVGNPHYLWWSRCGTQHSDPTNDNFSMFKGTLRQIFFNSMLKTLSQDLFSSSQLDRECYSFDLDCGLFVAKQTLCGKRENVLKKWKTLERYFLTDDIVKISSVIYNCYSLNKINPERLLSFEQAFKVFKQCDTIIEETKCKILTSFIIDASNIIKNNCNKISIYSPEQTLKSLNQYVTFNL